MHNIPSFSSLTLKIKKKKGEKRTAASISVVPLPRKPDMATSQDGTYIMSSLSSTTTYHILSLRHDHKTSHNKIMEIFVLKSPQGQREKWHCMCKGLMIASQLLLHINIVVTIGKISIGPSQDSCYSCEVRSIHMFQESAS